ncbi:hypothetical protein QE417_001791 [Mucilaginibacter terrae]|uniref:Uncharacterized protein n=1 Tax=Mucilaginibacter terrae TaxID=1955052 RepID=A0ABU3GSG6_9SPHI|nr:hypothetical protein [Mucilaginibacter terrae]
MSSRTIVRDPVDDARYITGIIEQDFSLSLEMTFFVFVFLKTPDAYSPSHSNGCNYQTSQVRGW